MTLALRATLAGPFGWLFVGVLCAGCDAPASPPPAAAEASFTVLSQPVERTPDPPVDSALWTIPVGDPELERGRLVWRGTCIACHSTGLGGAPLIGSESLWRPRIAQGVDVLVQHATQGYLGKVGEMPARGGNEALSDEEVRAAVLFMVSKVGS